MLQGILLMSLVVTVVNLINLVVLEVSINDKYYESFSTYQYSFVRIRPNTQPNNLRKIVRVVSGLNL